MGIFLSYGRSHCIHCKGIGERMPEFKSLSDMNFRDKRVVMRVDFNVPLNDKGKITDTTRIQETVPTIKKVLQEGAKQIILLSHLGRPKGQVVESLRLDPIAQDLAHRLYTSIAKLDVVSHPKVPDNVKIVMLENVRFDPREKASDPTLAREFANLGDIFVFDAFAVAHHASASVSEIAKFIPACAGLLVEKEIKHLSLENPRKPFMAIIGGAKLQTKIGVIENLAPKVNKLLLGGAMIFTFYKAQGYNVGDSLFDPKEVKVAKKLLKKYREKIVLPVDVVIANKFANNAKRWVVPINEIPDGWGGLDIGPHTIAMFRQLLHEARTVIWNGPMGVFEFPNFAKGTYEIAKLLASQTDTVTIAGGGDSVAAINKLGLASKFSHISTAGGAALEMLAGKTLPGIEALKQKTKVRTQRIKNSGMSKKSNSLDKRKQAKKKVVKKSAPRNRNTRKIKR